ncbi:MAG: hypothetical protein IKM20_08625 [Erysipelotrichales bacterium]|nr:hypothetical protein [Erysipelotrichales bacterium]
MIGKPKYKINDKVKFYFDNGVSKTLMNGEIRIVDAYGIFGNDEDVFYDINAIEDGKKVLYKHIPEYEIVE